MIRNAKVGERVKLTEKARLGGGSETAYHAGPNGKVVESHWPVGVMTGTIKRKEIFYKQSPNLWVTPDDPAGVGETRFRPSELERLPQAVPA